MMNRDRYHILRRYVELGDSLPPVEVLIESAAARRRAEITLMHMTAIQAELEAPQRGR
jgi:hypothetical protein